MIRSILVLSFLAAGCDPSEKIPGYDSHLHCNMEEGCTEWEPEAVAAELLDFQTRWQVLFDETPVVPEDIFVGDHFWYGFDIEAPDGCLYEGHADGTTVYVVGQRPDEDGEWHTIPLWNTTLPHESTHNALRAKTGNGDPDHAEGTGPWTKDHDLLIGSMYTADEDIVRYNCPVCY